MEVQKGYRQLMLYHHQAQHAELVRKETAARNGILCSRLGQERLAIIHLLNYLEHAADAAFGVLMGEFTSTLKDILQRHNDERQHMKEDFQSSFLARLEQADFHWSVISAPELHAKKMAFLQRVRALVHQTENSDLLMSAEMGYLSRAITYGTQHTFFDFIGRVSNKKNHRAHNLFPHYLFSNTPCHWDRCRATHPDRDWGVI